MKHSGSRGDGAEPGRQLEGLVAGIGAPFGRERSVKLTPGVLLTDRLLMTLHKAALGPVPQARLEELLSGLNFPCRFHARLAAELPRARIVHFGHEGGTEGTVVKLYLEFPPPGSGTHETGRLIHIAFKWEPASPERATTAYYRLAAGPEAAMAAALGDAADDMLRAVRAGIDAVLAEARRSPAYATVMALLVEEDDNPRRSLDLNLYDAELGVDACLAAFAPLWPAFGLPDNGRAEAARLIGGSRVGHVAAGMGRDGRPFFTIYYGLEGR